MAQQKQVINQIERGGITYVFQDTEAQANIEEIKVALKDTTDDLTGKLDDEILRAHDAEQGLKDTKVDKEVGKGLSANDFTDAYRDQLERPDVHAFVGATETEDGISGFVPEAKAGDLRRYLGVDGTWSIPKDTVYDEATHEHHGLMSVEDKVKLDNIMKYTYDEVSLQLNYEPETDSIIAIYGDDDQRRVVTTFGEDNMRQVITQSDSDPITLVTTYNPDGSITRVRS